MFNNQMNSVDSKTLSVSPEHQAFLKRVRRQKLMIRFTQISILILACRL